MLPARGAATGSHSFLAYRQSTHSMREVGGFAHRSVTIGNVQVHGVTQVCRAMPAVQGIAAFCTAFAINWESSAVEGNTDPADAWPDQ
jgi:hypothetical protein